LAVGCWLLAVFDGFALSATRWGQIRVFLDTQKIV